MRLARFIWRYYRRHLGWALIAFLSAPVYGAGSVAVVALIDPIFSEVLLAGSSASADEPQVSISRELPAHAQTVPRGLDLKGWVDHGYDSLKRRLGIEGRELIFFAPALLVIAFAIRGVADFAGGYAFQVVGLGVTTSISNDLQRHLLSQSTRFHARHPSGELISRVTSDVQRIQAALTSRVFDLIQQSVTLVLLVVLLISTEPVLGTGVLLGAPVFAYWLYRFGRAVRRSSRVSQERMAEVTRRLAESVRGHRVLQAFGAEEFEHRRFRAANARYLSESLVLRRLDQLSPLLIETGAVIMTAGFLMYAGLAVRSGRIAGPLLVQFIANVLLLYDPLRKLSKANLALQQAAAIGRRVLDLVDEPNDVVERPGACVVRSLDHGIVLERVTVDFDGRRVLDDINLEIRRGETIAIVGPSGAGKSTLVALLSRFLDPDEGRVLLDGLDIREATLSSLRRLVALAPQRPHLLDDSIRVNIALACPEASLDDVRAAARAACADEFILARPGGYDALVGEAGQILSGGERQRISIARALMAQSPVLVLDEATSELDSEAEVAVARSLRKVTAGRTLILIAHRLGTARLADRIVVLEEGRLVEAGAHEDLLKRGGTYRRLYEHWARYGDQ